MPNNNRRQRRRRTRPRLFYQENFPFSVNLGATATVQVSTLSNRPPRSNFRPVRATVEVAAPFVLGNDTRPGYYCPGGFQMQFHRPEGGGLQSTTGLRSLRPDLTRITLRYPRSGDWFTFDSSPSAPILELVAVCIGTASVTSLATVVRGTCKVLFQISPEIDAASCPGLPTLLTENGLVPQIDAIPSSSSYVMIEEQQD